MRLLFGEQGELLSTALLSFDATILAAGTLVLVVAVAALGLWLRGRSRRAGGGGARPRSGYRLAGNALMVVGAILTVAAGFVYAFEMTEASKPLPRPVALEGVGGNASAVTAPTETPTVIPTVTPSSTPTLRPTHTATAVATDEATPSPTVAPTEEPTSTPEPPEPTPVPEPAPSSGGIPTRMVIEAIGVDSKVVETGTYWQNGQLIWQTQPWAIAYYGITGRIGESGNASFSGHVTTRNYGNVFKDLYKVQLGDTIQVYSGGEQYTYVVDSIRLVQPDETSVMDPTPDPVITLITCAGEWMPAEQSYTERLVVRAKLEG